MFTTGNLKHTFSALCLVALSAFNAYASPAFTVTGSGTSYSVIGSGLEGIAGITLTLGYDSSSLASPTVSQGSLISGSMIMPNTNSSGSIIIGVINPNGFSGSGQIVAINFASQKGSGSITSCQVNSLIDSNSKSISSSCTVASGGGNTTSNTPGIPFSQPTTAAPVAPTTQPGSPVYLGPLNPSADTAPKTEPKPVEPPAPPAAQPAEPPAHAADEQPVEEKKVVVPQKPREMRMISPTATLDNFRTYQGEKSPAIFVALISREISPNIHQEPVVALSDGKTTVKILVKLAAGDEESPNFALNGARMVALSKDDAAATWVIEALPQMGILQASLTILAGSDIIDFPLTLAPAVSGISSEEADFAAFLKDSGAVPPKRDLNGDRRHNYLDDFIYTANYLSQKGATSKARQ